jgi:hypothetical protein
VGAAEAVGPLGAVGGSCITMMLSSSSAGAAQHTLHCAVHRVPRDGVGLASVAVLGVAAACSAAASTGMPVSHGACSKWSPLA